MVHWSTFCLPKETRLASYIMINGYTKAWHCVYMANFTLMFVVGMFAGFALQACCAFRDFLDSS